MTLPVLRHNSNNRAAQAAVDRRRGNQNSVPQDLARRPRRRSQYHSRCLHSTLASLGGLRDWSLQRAMTLRIRSRTLPWTHSRRSPCLTCTTARSVCTSRLASLSRRYRCTTRHQIAKRSRRSRSYSLAPTCSELSCSLPVDAIHIISFLLCSMFVCLDYPSRAVLFVIFL